MADDVPIKDANNLTVNIHADDTTSINGVTVSGVKAEVAKAAFGVSGTTTYVTSSSPLPTADSAALTDIQATRDRIGATSSPAAGSVNAQLAAINTNTDGIETALGLLATQSTLASVLSALAGNLLALEVAPSASAVTRVSASASAVTLKAAQSGRRGLMVFNESSVVLYVKFGSAATTTDYTLQVPAGYYYEMPPPYYRGIVTGVWASATGAAQITEIT